MKVLYGSYNFIEWLKSIFRKYIVLVPIIILLVALKILLKINISNDMIQNVVSISGTLAGFLFTAFSIILSFPEDKPFMRGLKDYGYIKRLFLCIFLGLIAFICTIIISIFNILSTIILPLFVLGILYTLIAAIYLFTISFYISK